MDDINYRRLGFFVLGSIVTFIMVGSLSLTLYSVFRGVVFQIWDIVVKEYDRIKKFVERYIINPILSVYFFIKREVIALIGDVDKAYKYVSRFIVGAANLIYRDGKIAYNYVRRGVLDVYNFIKGVALRIYHGLKSAYDDTKDAVEDAVEEVENVADDAVKVVETIFDSVRDGVEEVFDDTKEGLDKIIGVFKSI